MEAAACVSVVDDDALVLRSIGRLLRSAGFTVRTFPSPQAFLAQGGGDPGCVVIDLSLPGTSGLNVQRDLASSGDPAGGIHQRPRRHPEQRGGDEGRRGRLPGQALRHGAAGGGRRRDAEGSRRARRARQHASIRRCLAALTPREREVCERVVQGKLNKQIAAELGTSEKTVKVHRARMMRKMGADSLAGLVRAWTAIPPTSAAAP